MSIISILMTRDKLTREQAREALEDAQQEVKERLATGDMPYDICEELFGLEPDYLDELIGG